MRSRPQLSGQLPGYLGSGSGQLMYWYVTCARAPATVSASTKNPKIETTRLFIATLPVGGPARPADTRPALLSRGVFLFPKAEEIPYRPGAKPADTLLLGNVRIHPARKLVVRATLGGAK